MAETVRYPDGMVLCGPVSASATFVEQPTIVFEILSPSTHTVDRIDKCQEYASVRSVQRYVMLEQDRIAATVFERPGEDWVAHLLLSGQVLAMPEIGIELSLNELYDGIAVPQASEGEDQPATA